MSDAGPVYLHAGIRRVGRRKPSQGFFQGRLDLIGWRPSGPDEAKAVEQARGSKPWNPDIAQHHAATHQAAAQAAQGASRNVLGIGIYSTRGIDVGYSRVLGATEPYARGQVLLETQLFVDRSRGLGGSIGLSGEYQEPLFFAKGGVRLSGSATLDTRTGRVDIAPFVGAGTKLGQRVRLGAEAFTLLPLTGQGVRLGAGLTLGVELD